MNGPQPHGPTRITAKRLGGPVMGWRRRPGHSLGHRAQIGVRSFLFLPSPQAGAVPAAGLPFPRGTIPATIYPDMALRFHRSMKVFPGVRLNFGGPASLGAENRNRIP